MFEVKNKMNYIPITLYLIWNCYLFYYLFFRLDNLDVKSASIAGYMMMIIPIFTLIFTFFTIGIVTILNQIKGNKLYSDYQFIFMQFLIAIMLFVM